MSNHTCHAKQCSKEVPPELLMCGPHWRQVPPNLKRAVWDNYVSGQEVRKDPTDEYLAAALEAIDAVAVKEGVQ